MNLFYKKTFIFSLIVVSILFGIESYIEIKGSQNDYYRATYDELYNHEVNADVVIFGASHAKHGINPKYFNAVGINAFNFSLNGASPRFTRRWYDQVFTKLYAKPKVVIYEVNWFMFSPDWLWRKLEHDSRYLRFHLIKDSLLNGSINFEQYLKNRIYLLSGGENYKKVLRPNKANKLPQNILPDHEYKGFVPYADISKNYEIKKYDVVENDDLKEDFFQLIKEMQLDGVKVIFVQAPEYLPGRESDEIEKFNSFVADFAIKRDIPFLNYNIDPDSSLNMDKTNFFDWGHLNLKGSSAFSEILVADVSLLLGNTHVKD